MCVQSFKRKPGRADNERSLGDANERVHKRLRTVESAERREQEHPPGDTQQESDMYEHVRHGEDEYDTQTYGETLFTVGLPLSQTVLLHSGTNFILITNTQRGSSVYLSLDTASTEQQKPTSMKHDGDDDDDEDGDVAMETDEEKEMQAVDAPELKPEKMDSSRSSQRGRCAVHVPLLSSLLNRFCVGIPGLLTFYCLFSL